MNNNGVWFNIPNEQQSASICLRISDFSIIKDIREKATIKEAQFYEQNYYLSDNIDEDLYQENLIDFCIVDWKNIYDEEGNLIPCTKENKSLLMGKSVEFANFVNQKQRELNKLISENTEKIQENLINYCEWMREKPDCKACQQIYKKKEEEPPCSTCRPPLFASNEDIINVYLLVQDQVNVSFSGQIIGLRIEAVCDVMEILEIKDRKDCLRRVIDLFRHFQKEDEMKRGK